MINKLFSEFPDTRITFINKLTNTFWPHWKKYNECTQEEQKIANLRELFPNEIVIDIDNNKDYELVISKLTNYNYYSYNTGSRGFHISLFFNNITFFSDEQRTEIRKTFIKNLGLPDEFLHKISEKTALAMENRHHFKTGNIKKLIAEVPGINVLDYDIIQRALLNIESREKKIQKKEIDFINYHEADPFFNFIKTNILQEGTSRNNIIFKNVAIALVKEGLKESEIKELMIPIVEKNFPGKAISEFMGWVKKAFNNEINDYNLIEINNWGKIIAKKEFYDLKPIPIDIKIEKTIDKEHKRFISDKELEELESPEVRWLVDKWIPSGDICFIAGKASSFKTTTTLHLAYAISKGKLVFNTYQTNPCKVLYLNDENYLSLFKNAFVKRVKKGLDIENEKEENIYFSIMENLRLENEQDILDIIKFVNENNIKVIVFDSFRRFFVGKENDADTINEIFNKLKVIRKACKDCTIIVIHHAKKDSPGQQMDIRDILRGSSDIVNSADSVIAIKRKHGHNAILIEHIKNRAGEEMVGKIIAIDCSENKAYFYETAVEPNQSKVQSEPEKCAEAIISLAEDKKLSFFQRKDINEINEKFARDTITKALRILCSEGTIVVKGSGKYVTYLVNNIKSFEDSQ